MAAEKKGGDGMVSAVYKVNLHCKECAREVRKIMRKTKGVQNVEVDLEERKVTVVGKVDGKKIREVMEKKTKKKVEMVSVEAKKDDPAKKEAEELKVVTTVIKVQMHCEKCEYDLKRTLLKVKGVRTVKINSDAQTCTVEGIVESQKLVEHIQKKFSHKFAEIVPQKKKETKPEEKEKEKKVEKKKEITIKEVEVVVKEKSKEEKKEQWKWEEGSAPYFVHCSHGSELFSDENPNACFVM